MADGGGQKFADTVTPFLEATNTIILRNHGTVSFGKDLQDAYWKTEILDAYCRILLLAKQLGGMSPLPGAAIARLRKLGRDL